MAPLGHPLHVYSPKYGSIQVTDSDRVRARKVLQMTLDDLAESGDTGEMFEPFAAIIHWALRNRRITQELRELEANSEGS